MRGTYAISGWPWKRGNNAHGRYIVSPEIKPRGSIKFAPIYTRCALLSFFSVINSGAIEIEWQMNFREMSRAQHRLSPYQCHDNSLCFWPRYPFHDLLEAVNYRKQQNYPGTATRDHHVNFHSVHLKAIYTQVHTDCVFVICSNTYIFSTL